MRNLQNPKARLAWLALLFIFAVFFFADGHNLFWTIQDRGGAEEAATRVEEGSIARRISFLCLGGFGMISLMRKNRKRIRVNGFLGWLILFYLVWSFLSLTWTVNATLTFRRLMLLGVLCLGALAVAERFSVRNIVLGVFFSTTFYLLMGLLAEIGLGTFCPLAPDYRFSGTLHPNHQGINCALLLLAAVCLMKSAKRWQGFFLAIALVAFVFLILTKSRTSFASVIFALGAYWSLVLPRSRKLALVLCTGFTICLLPLVVGDALFPALRQGVFLGREDPSSYTLTGRIPLWNECLEYVSRRPLQGYGYGAFWTPRHLREISAAQGWGIGSGHSAYLDVLLGLGVVGLIAYVLILVAGIRRSFAYYTASVNTAYPFFGVLLMFSVLDGLLESTIFNATLPTFLSMVILVRLGFQVPPRHEGGS